MQSPLTEEPAGQVHEGRLETSAHPASPFRPPLVTRLGLRNYKSIGACSVALGPIQFLVGPNGAGKSNFLDALAFVSDALNGSVEQALRERGGIDRVRRHSHGHPTHFAIKLDLQLESGLRGAYLFEIGAGKRGSFSLKQEAGQLGNAYFCYEGGRLVHSTEVLAPQAHAADHLVLPLLGGQETFRPLAEALRRMAFYNLNPARMRDLQDPDPGLRLLRDGGNLASVIREMTRGHRGEDFGMAVNGHLRAIAPGMESVSWDELGPKETLEFRQRVAGDQHPWRFPASSISDGTLRALGLLVACSQGAPDFPRRASLVGIEEPESALHPGAAEAVTDFLLMASRQVQILATTHSPKILDHKGLTDEQILVVESREGESLVGPMDPVSRAALRDRLYSAGELLSRSQMQPDPAALDQKVHLVLPIPSGKRDPSRRRLPPRPALGPDSAVKVCQSSRPPDDQGLRNRDGHVEASRVLREGRNGCAGPG